MALFGASFQEGPCGGCDIYTKMGGLRLNLPGRGCGKSRACRQGPAYVRTGAGGHCQQGVGRLAVEPRTRSRKSAATAPSFYFNFATWTVACQASLPVEFSRRQYWSGLPFSSPEGLSDPGIKSASPALQVDSLPLSHRGRPGVLL